MWARHWTLSFPESLRMQYQLLLSIKGQYQWKQLKKNNKIINIHIQLSSLPQEMSFSNSCLVNAKVDAHPVFPLKTHRYKQSFSVTGRRSPVFPSKTVIKPVSRSCCNIQQYREVSGFCWQQKQSWKKMQKTKQSGWKDCPWGACVLGGFRMAE